MLVLSRARVFARVSLLVLLSVIVAFASGWFLSGGKTPFLDPSFSADAKRVLEQELARQQKIVDDAVSSSSANLDALAIELGRLQAKIMRVEALGGRLSQMAGVDEGEFDFSRAPAAGGPYSPSYQQTSDLPIFLDQLREISGRIADREQQLEMLSQYIIDDDIREEIHPEGWPIDGGWISSSFGYRNDPFTGKREFHKGLDFAHKLGSKIVSVAAGVVTWSGPKHGYGNLIEIDHGNGYKTRYGHNAECYVKVGQFVKKKQAIAAMGSTGRSTGPHVHFEVIHQGKPVNPSPFLTASR